ALNMGARMLGQVAPNPAVGCVIVKDGVIVGRGVTQAGGRPHAETQALAQAGELARGATAYVTLEPCSHHGKTPPCSEGLIGAGIKRVVATMEDPDPRVSGKGFSMLQAAGIEVVNGVLAEEAAFQQEGFLKRIKHGRPLFTLKLASTLDGRIATESGESRWITGETARHYVHTLRANHDAVMVGIGTVLADDPELTCRLPGLEHASPIRIVVDRQLNIPMKGKLAITANEKPCWVITREKSEAGKIKDLEKRGIKVLTVPTNDDGYIDLGVAARKLGEQGLTRVLVEGGAYLAAALIKDGVVDRLEWITSPSLIGDDGKPSLKPMGVETLAQRHQFKPYASRMLGNDRLESFVRGDKC
ncbi:MAG: bifunctional diaminohydroxyphosphoribosylaminopyrimidine deaminase/5-amino-6-(5-phosphoribosylamino)uracil reductase RibD, partial [Alphaproteobacteria bacterium]|nr:bifunctional diaminohydroxyphosphoribosylaminopyrimidine deaminase/5-amino-6-(5-phosphoribosylamino)uracil reductase RibD [Alphaproteobacteria bacterium]